LPCWFDGRADGRITAGGQGDPMKRFRTVRVHPSLGTRVPHVPQYRRTRDVVLLASTRDNARGHAGSPADLERHPRPAPHPTRRREPAVALQPARCHIRRRLLPLRQRRHPRPARRGVRLQPLPPLRHRRARPSRPLHRPDHERLGDMRHRSPRGRTRHRAGRRRGRRCRVRLRPTRQTLHLGRQRQPRASTAPDSPTPPTPQPASTSRVPPKPNTTLAPCSRPEPRWNPGTSSSSAPPTTSTTSESPSAAPS
jgi:hypothetical protein